jgi:hypothetical protein
MAGPEPADVTTTPAVRPARRWGGWVWLTSGVAAVVGLLIGMMIMLPQGQDRTAQPQANPTIPVPAATVTTEITMHATETQKITAPPQTREVTATVRSTRTVSAAPRPRITVTKTVTQAPEDFDGGSGGEEESEDQDEGAYYRNCSAARAAGAAPLYTGDPGYGPHLDRDGDGVACES